MFDVQMEPQITLEFFVHIFGFFNIAVSYDNNSVPPLVKSFSLRCSKFMSTPVRVEEVRR